MNLTWTAKGSWGVGEGGYSKKFRTMWYLYRNFWWWNLARFTDFVNIHVSRQFSHVYIPGTTLLSLNVNKKLVLVLNTMPVMYVYVMWLGCSFIIIVKYYYHLCVLQPYVLNCAFILHVFFVIVSRHKFYLLVTKACQFVN